MDYQEPTYTKAELAAINEEMKTYCEQRQLSGPWRTHKSIAAILFRRMLELGVAQEEFYKNGTGAKNVSTYKNIVMHLGDMLEKHRIHFDDARAEMSPDSIWLPKNSCLYQ